MFVCNLMTLYYYRLLTDKVKMSSPLTIVLMARLNAREIEAAYLQILCKNLGRGYISSFLFMEVYVRQVGYTASQTIAKRFITRKLNQDRT